ncbi:ComEA family DNA-binding protein [Deinococcus aestuarii]|uniref:ComEA family DNA-binding protein n=1 Tax=Deinococcus aestuarii TaxID=2774531 RepID=UPI001C0DB96F|nr:helix-hairpin-helix domain-containing protein [Deinococcus aestuarii]
MNRSTSFALLAALTVTGLAGAQSQVAGKTAAPTAQVAKGMTMTGSSCAKVLKARVNLNRASQADLQCLKGVSATTARDIIANRPFKDSGDFSRKIEVIGRKLWNDNRANLTF